MSDRLYAYIPIKEDYNSIEKITTKIQSILNQEASIRVEGKSIDVISKYYPLYIEPCDYDSSYWEIFVWRNCGYIISNEAEDKDNRRFLRDVCKILGSNECWYCGEIILFDYVLCEDQVHIDLGKEICKSIDYKEYINTKSRDCNNQPFIHDDFSDLD